MDDNEIVCTIKWSVEDVREALKKAGYRPSNANVKKVIDNRLERTMQDRSIEEGWEILSDIVILTEGLSVKRSDPDDDE